MTPGPEEAAPTAAHSDVLVIGAGSAGSVVAERLSADPGCSVTVLEVGPGPSDPGVAALTDNGMVLPVGAASRLVARFLSTLTERPARTAHLVRGATVGGSGAVRCPARAASGRLCSTIHRVALTNKHIRG